MLCSIGLMTLIPMASYVGLIAWSGDLGGPLNLIFIPAMSVALGFVVSLLIFLPLSLLAETNSGICFVGANCNRRSGVDLLRS